MGMLKALELAFGSFRSINPDMPIQQAALFVQVCKKENITHAELSAALDMPQASVSRNVLKLAQKMHRDELTGTLSVIGLGLLENKADLYEPRRYAVSLTPRGKALKAQLEAVEC